MKTRIGHRIGSLLLAFGGLTPPPPASAASDELEINEEAAKSMAVAVETEGQVRWEPGQIIVKFRDATERGTGPQFEAMGLEETEKRWTSGGEMIFTLGDDVSTRSAAADATEEAMEVARRLSQRAEVEYAQVNYIVDIAAEPIDPGYADQWHYRTNGSGGGQSNGGINLPQAWDITTGDPGIVVAVIDTGILPNHPDISGSANQLGGYDMITSTFTAQDGDGRDSDPTDVGDAVAAAECPPSFRNPARGSSWHGTHVAGTVGVVKSNDANGVAGVSWKSGIISVRVLGKCGGNVGDINDAIRWAAGMPVPGVPANPKPAKVINMSLGAGIPCSSSPSTQAAIDDVGNLGVTVVVAAGNESMDASNAMPASCSGVIAVAAGDGNGNLVNRYSNFGPVVDILAPGGDTQGSSGAAGGVLSTVDGGYAFYNGTSMASPHVAGVAALMLSVDSTLSPQDVESTLKNTAMPRTAQQCSQACGSGLLNAVAALNSLGGSPGPGPGPAPTLGVSQSSIRMDNGDTEQLVASLTSAGAGVSGKDVRFTSSDPATITVSPAVRSTDGSGNAATTVTALKRGDAQITVETVGGGVTTVPVTVDVTVAPLLSWVMFVLLLAALGWLFLHRTRHARRP